MHQTGFNEFEPLLDFESLFPSYESLRSKVEAKMDTWLSTPDLDATTCPRNVSVRGHEMRTLVNANFKVKVAGVIENFDIGTGGFNNGPSLSSSCGLMGISRKTVAFDSDKKKIVAYVTLNPNLLGTTVSGEAAIYSKNSRGNWEGFKTKTVSQIQGRLNRFLSCNLDHQFSKFDHRNKSSTNWVWYRAWFRPALFASDQDISYGIELPNFGGVGTVIPLDVWQ